jgi:sugar lactone lactonase YvrE
MKPTIYSILYCFTILTLIASCSGIRASKGQSCIPPNNTTNYELNLRRQNELTAPRMMPMPSWWNPQLTKSIANKIRRTSIFDIVFQVTDEIWLASYADDSGNSIIRYRTDIGDIKGYGIIDETGKGYTAGDLYVASDGNLWARVINRNEYSLLAVYDPKLDKFEIVIDQANLLTPQPNIEISWNGRTQPVLNEEPDGKLVVTLNGEIFLYNSKTNQAKRILSRSKGFDVNSISVSEDGHVWFTSSNELSIRELDPISGSIIDYGPPPNTENDPMNLFSLVEKVLEIDNEGRIWVSDFGWLEKGLDDRYVWHSVARSSLFISIYDKEYEYIWIRPSGVYQFSDGNIWYASGLGIIRFNEKNGEWCWKATESGLLAEDEKGNLWLIANGQLYKYNIEE